MCTARRGWLGKGFWSWSRSGSATAFRAGDGMNGIGQVPGLSLVVVYFI